LSVRRNGGESGDIAATQVFSERGLHGPANFSSGKFHGHKMTLKRNGEKEKGARLKITGPDPT
jgi:hypothetical protein